ncbi:DUF3616 domain-containing protein [Vineibacter terrae]|uniref:DUF3616 domain-containing protein n=1 Tax=Vineibacter terrae TaxID=2586908 RepID=A0A5C8PIR5_9HYPH|nr:DUF3616 domain-containing protein [Vineibacter terrae]TXL73535.1 DUF3616 domain-containing protein [Vineibacter terrae]
MTRSRPVVLAVAACFSVSVATAVAAPDDIPPVAPESGPWDAGDGFKFDKKEKKKRKALSGIACPANASGQRLCLAVFDEGGEARYLVIRDGAYTVDNEPVVLVPGDVELDAEAAATGSGFYYVTGSHSAKRNDCDNNPESRRVIRFRVDPGTGRALRAAGPGAELAGYASTDRLWTVMAAVPGLKDHVGNHMCLGTQPPKDAPHLPGKRGVNIEGLAFMGGRLFFGFRGPAIDGTARILDVDADALFGTADPGPKLSTIWVGPGRAIRDLHAVRDGILVLAGPDDDAQNKDVPWIVMRWDGQHTGSATGKPKPLARLVLDSVVKRPCDDELKPEAMAVVDDKPGEPYRVIIFSDGMCDGGPLGFSIRR